METQMSNQKKPQVSWDEDMWLRPFKIVAFSDLWNIQDSIKVKLLTDVYKVD